MSYCHQCPSVGCLVGHNNFVRRAYRSTCKIHNQMDDEKIGSLLSSQVRSLQVVIATLIQVTHFYWVKMGYIICIVDTCKGITCMYEKVVRSFRLKNNYPRKNGIDGLITMSYYHFTDSVPHRHLDTAEPISLFPRAPSFNFQVHTFVCCMCI